MILNFVRPPSPYIITFRVFICLIAHFYCHVKHRRSVGVCGRCAWAGSYRFTTYFKYSPHPHAHYNTRRSPLRCAGDIVSLNVCNNCFCPAVSYIDLSGYLYFLCCLYGINSIKWWIKKTNENKVGLTKVSLKWHATKSKRKRSSKTLRSPRFNRMTKLTVI